jgi:hypothetical protein
LFSDVGAAGTACPDFSGALIGSDFAAGAIFSGGAFCCAAGGAAGVSSFFMPCADTAPAPSSNIAAVVDISRSALMDVSCGHSAIVWFVDVCRDNAGRHPIVPTIQWRAAAVAAINRRLPDEYITGIFLLLSHFDKQLEYRLSVRFVAQAIEKTPVALDISASDELIHVGLGSWGPSLADCLDWRRQSEQFWP